jgi:hypothetical protein
MLGAAALTLTVAGPARAECINAFMMGLAEYDQGAQTTRTTFQTNEPMVLCVETTRGGFVSIYDAPIEGDFEQLYPNMLTHPAGDTYTEIEAGTLYCFGTRDTFPMYHPPNEGVGVGKISISLTASPEAQLNPDDYAIPGQRVARTTMDLHLSSHMREGDACTERDVKYINYQIVN